ncbi:hypothetical protein PV729_25830 [Streptomyces europaeiscabiei]|uniref:Uncharacterized protein n=1 Tax=Streptomyces europaeiscabiei TaxID=146819 RepID=A0ABU4NUE0_9ACTN|nr:hypothetical protein [Streptomyces europaeiscabiei]MDX3548805.1 hypothetical protein [Streptomyces europaeiscabiei]MDX3555141.1 hypothetical protein [Streptomyces europaeiscabiei]MDX3705155.1 hypothetical protein [Streptomyces europaeiscabiei]
MEFFGPPTIQKIFQSQPVRFSAATDSGREGWAVALSRPANMRNAPQVGSDCSDVYDWAKRQGGADAGESKLLLAAQGQRRRDIAITNMRAKIVRRYPIPTSAEVICPTAGEGVVIGVGLDLDSQNPVAKVIDDSGNLKEAYFSGRYVTLAEHEITTFNVVATAKRYAYDWVLEVEILEDGKRGVVTVRDGDKPFRTAPYSAKYSQRYEWAIFSSPPSLIGSPG